MTRSGRGGAVVITTWMLAAGACVAAGPRGDGDGETSPGDGGGRDDGTCTEDSTRCLDRTLQSCAGGRFVDVERCEAPLVCSWSAGCVECDPRLGFTCVGDSVHHCDDDGSVGSLVETCTPGPCRHGSCGSDGCADAAKPIYLVTDTAELLRFDPAMGANTFTVIGEIDCPAGPEWPDRGGDSSHPYSMSVDRDARAWVLYTSGELFHVSTTDASCERASWTPDAGRFELFAMAFVSDAPDSSEEHLFIAGGPAANPANGSLAAIAPSTMDVDVRGDLIRRELAPELSGTGDAELYAYYPSTEQSVVTRLYQDSADTGEQWSLPRLSGFPTGWAFAHWGGRFYVFITDVDLTTHAEQSNVYLLDPETGDARVILSDIPHKVVGAGVSTCAPVVLL